MGRNLFISYSHADDALLDRLHKHLAQLQRDGSISGWFDREIHAGARIDDEIHRALEQADIFLACVSPDYIASNYCYDDELNRALEKEAHGDLAIVPVIFEPSDWLSTPLQKFKALPKDGKAISEYTNQNVAFLNVVSELRRLLGSFTDDNTISIKSDQGLVAEHGRASRYRVKRDHDELHKRDFGEDAFNEIYKFFEASVAEIVELPEIDARLSQKSADHFSCTIINRGMKRSYETLHVRRGGRWGAIDILYGEHNAENTSNGGFSVESDDFELYLRPAMFTYGSDDKKLTPRAAGQMLWDGLLSRVGVTYD